MADEKIAVMGTALGPGGDDGYANLIATLNEDGTVTWTWEPLSLQQVKEIMGMEAQGA